MSDGGWGRASSGGDGRRLRAAAGGGVRSHVRLGAGGTVERRGDVHARYPPGGPEPDDGELRHERIYVTTFAGFLFPAIIPLFPGRDTV